MGVTCGAGTAYPFRASELTPVFSEVCVARSLVFSVVFCRLLFVLLSFFLLTLVLSVLLRLRLLVTSLVSSNFALFNIKYSYSVHIKQLLYQSSVHELSNVLL